MTVPWCNRQGT